MSQRPLAVVVLSGGLDSSTLVAEYVYRDHDVLAVTVDYGQRHVREISSARDIAAHYSAEHLIIDLSGIGVVLSSALTQNDITIPDGHYAEDSMKATVVPNRNAILANIAIGIAVSRGADVVALGMHAGDHAVYPDCRPEFVETLNRLCTVANEGFNPPRVEAPFIHITKTDIALRAARLKVPVRLTWSCYKGGEVHCGTCGTCYERREAFHDAGVSDPTEYATITLPEATGA